MRFCPFCGAENADDVPSCGACARKLPAAVVRRPAAAGPEPTQPLVLPEPRKASIPPPPPRDATQPRASSPSGQGQGKVPQIVATTSRPASASLPRFGEGSRPVTGTGREPTESALATRVIQLPQIEEARKQLPPMPVVPDGGLLDAARYSITFLWARWKRKKVVKDLSAQVVGETGVLDGVLGELGKAARAVKLEGRVFADENTGIDEAERRRDFAEQACEELTGKKTDENAKYEGVQRDLAARLAERQEAVKEIAAELERLEAQRRGLRERKKDVEGKQRALEKSAADRESGPEVSAAARESAAALRREARKLDEERADIDGRLAGLEKPIADATIRHQQAKQDLDAGKKDLANAKEGHRHKHAELDSETARRYKDLQSAEAEIARRLVTLGTIVNLNRPVADQPEFRGLFERCDELRALISARETEIERLEAERDAFDRPSLVRGVAVLVATLFAVLLVVFVVRAL